jgi:lipooligosaccharide transport system ATP-binding protein
LVNDVSFAIAPGECLGVIGPNGAGKTTTIRMCLGLTAPDAAGALLRPTAPAAAHAARRAGHQGPAGRGDQFDTLDPDFTCAENLRSMAATSA